MPALSVEYLKRQRRKMDHEFLKHPKIGIPAHDMNRNAREKTTITP